MGYWLTMPNRTTTEQGTMTVIMVYPHVLHENGPQAKVLANKKCQTAVRIVPLMDQKRFLSSLQFTPYREIQEDCIRIIDLPRRVYLQFSKSKHDLRANAKRLTLCDDDGVSEMCLDYLNLQNNECKSTMVENSVQTDLCVKPYILCAEQVATVFQQQHTQTD